MCNRVQGLQADLLQITLVQDKMRRTGDPWTSQHSPKLAVRLEALHDVADVCRVQSNNVWSDGQTFASLGAAGIDDSPAAAGLHADQETMGTGPANF